MATINKKLVHFNLRTEFEKRKAAGDILESSICWIKDAKLIYTHGTYYDCSTLDLSSYVTTTALISALASYALTSDLSKKQDAITDLATIRSNAAKGATALQSVPDEYVTETELTNKGYATTSAMNAALGNKVDKVSGKQLSTEDFTTALKNKLSGLSNYDDTAINNAISGLQTQINTLVSGDANTAIESFNEIIAFLEGVTDTQTLEGIIAGIEQQIATKQDIITDLATIRSGAAKGATALQSHQDISHLATKTELNNGLAGKVSTVSGKGLSTNDYTTTEKNKLSGIAAGAEVNVQSDWNTTDTSDDSYIKNKPSLSTVATSGSYNDLSNKPTIPSAVTESTVSGWGFTKNTGTYSKPSTGIPKTDLASAVQTSLSKADTALQSYTEQYTGTYSKPSGGIPKSDLASAVQTSLGKADTALQSFTETDPVFKASAAAGITSSDITNWNSKTSNTGTITGIKMNGASKGTSGVVDLGNIPVGDGTITKIVYVSALPSNPDSKTLYLIP